jgi:hypothetical protein
MEKSQVLTQVKEHRDLLEDADDDEIGVKKLNEHAEASVPAEASVHSVPVANRINY